MDSEIFASKVEMVAPNAVITDSRVNTRPIDHAWVTKKLRAGFDPDRIGVPIVSVRDDGIMVWLDGQNRGALCKKAGRGMKRSA